MICIYLCGIFLSRFKTRIAVRIIRRSAAAGHCSAAYGNGVAAVCTEILNIFFCKQDTVIIGIYHTVFIKEVYTVTVNRIAVKSSSLIEAEVK